MLILYSSTYNLRTKIWICTSLQLNSDSRFQDSRFQIPDSRFKIRYLNFIGIFVIRRYFMKPAMDLDIISAVFLRSIKCFLQCIPDQSYIQMTLVSPQNFSYEKKLYKFIFCLSSYPSAILAIIDTEALRIWSLRPKSFEKFPVPVWMSTSCTYFLAVAKHQIFKFLNFHCYIFIRIKQLFNL